jgi:hypothetical protein
MSVVCCHFAGCVTAVTGKIWKNRLMLEVREKEKVGGFYFDKGVLINAVQCNMNGKLVAMEMMQWTADYLVFRAVPQPGVSKQIHQPVDVLAKDAEKYQEERTSPKPAKAAND